MKKLRHNKKRNTAFLYECLIREVTKSVIEKNPDRKKQVIKIIKDNFGKDSQLAEELSAYRAIYETSDVEKDFATKIISEAKKQHAFYVDSAEVFKQQTKLIKSINKDLGSQVFNNFVPNYKNLATIYQVFNEKNIKKRVVLEGKLLEAMIGESSGQQMKPINNLVFKTFSNKFNDEYDKSLLKEQKDLLNEYILSFSDNSLSLKSFLNEEIGRLSDIVSSSLELDEVKNDEEMVSKTKDILNIIESFRERKVDRDMIEKVIKIQNLANEIKKDDN